MEVDTNELLHRIGAVLRVISDKMDWLIDIGERVEGEVRLPSELEAQTFANAKEPAKEPPKKWRILEPGEMVCSGDRVNAKTNPPSNPPHGLGWLPADASVGTSVYGGDLCVFARPVSDEPAKETDHPAGPKPDPGEGYRILSKDPLEDLQEGDEFWFQAKWYRSAWSHAYIKDQEKNLWYRRKIEPPKDEYREPVLPADAGKLCEFSDDGRTWETQTLMGFSSELKMAPWESETCLWEHARIKKDA